MKDRLPLGGINKMAESKRFGTGKILVDLDETLFRYDGSREYHHALPIQKNIEKVNALYDAGKYIIAWTARGGNSGICHRELTERQLKEFGVRYNELSTGTSGNYIKAAHDLILDDKAMSIERLDVADYLANGICDGIAVDINGKTEYICVGDIITVRLVETYEIVDMKKWNDTTYLFVSQKINGVEITCVSVGIELWVGNIELSNTRYSGRMYSK